MAWMALEPDRRASPARLWPEVRSVIMLGVNYGTVSNTLAILGEPDRASISLYARRRDYHETIKGRLKELAGLIAAQGADVKVFVDTAPVMEKSLAQSAGFGWQGKSTVMISRDFGAWLFLGAIYTTLDIKENASGHDLCGQCTRCLNICPTKAFPSPYMLDARRCIAYLTIEHKGLIPNEFRTAIGNRVFGCDDCLAVCPWNKFAQECRDSRLALRPDLDGPDLGMLAALDEQAFRRLFAGSPVKRTGRERFIRNVLTAIGNSGKRELAAHAEALLGDPSPVVRGTAVWALSQLLEAEEFLALRGRHFAHELEEAVRGEWLIDRNASCD